MNLQNTTGNQLGPRGRASSQESIPDVPSCCCRSNQCHIVVLSYLLCIVRAYDQLAAVRAFKLQTVIELCMMRYYIDYGLGIIKILA
jgi:hypothetical protein